MVARTTDVRVRISADMAALQAQFAAGEVTAKSLARQMDLLQAKYMSMNAVEGAAYREEAARNEKRVAGFGKVGQAATLLGATIGLGLGLATKAASDWEAAFANVEKVVGRGAGTDVLEQQLRDLAKTLPVSAEEIAKVATTAGQLGVAKQNLAAFTKVAIELGSTTSMSAEDAATGLAKLGNVLDPTHFAANIDKAGSALLALGNFGASTEQQILDMAERISGAGKIVGLTEPQVLGFANALTSVGINAEEGGSAISRLLETLYKVTQSGGSELTKFAGVAGMSGQQFRKAFGADAAGATTAFIAGLSKMQANGGNTLAMLDQLGLKNIRITDVLLRSTAAVKLLADSVALGTKAWSEDTALQDAAALKYQTTAAKVEIAKNNLNDMAITLGQTFLPIVGDAAGKVTAMAQAFGALPAPARASIAALGGIAAAGLTVGGAALYLVPKVHDLLGALDEMGPKGARAAGALRSVGSVLAGPWGIALAAGTIALGAWLEKQVEAAQRVEDLKNTLDAQTGVITDNSKTWAANQLIQDGTLDAAKRLGLNLADVTNAALGQGDAVAKVNAALAQYQDAITGKGAADGTRQVFTQDEQAARKVAGAVGDTNTVLADARTKWQDLQAATGGATGVQGTAQGAIDATTGALKDQAGAADAAKQAVSDFDQALKDLFDTELGGAADKDKLQSDLNSLAQQFKDATTGKTTGGKVNGADVAKARADARKEAADLGKTPAQIKAAGDAAAAAVRSREGGKSGAVPVLVDVAKGTDDAAIRIRESLRKLVEDSLTVLADEAKRGIDPKVIDQDAKAFEARIAKAAASVGLKGRDVQAYTDALEAVPGQVSTTFAAPGLSAVTEQLGTLLTRVGLVNGKMVDLQVDQYAGNVREGRSATGLQVHAIPVPVQANTSTTTHIGTINNHYTGAGSPSARRFGANGVG